MDAPHNASVLRPFLKHKVLHLQSLASLRWQGIQPSSFLWDLAQLEEGCLSVDTRHHYKHGLTPTYDPVSLGPGTTELM